MKYLHTMLRVRNLDEALDFFCNKLGLKEARRYDDQKGRYTNVFLAGPDDESLVASELDQRPPRSRAPSWTRSLNFAESRADASSPYSSVKRE